MSDSNLAPDINEILISAFNKRGSLFKDSETNAFRVFNGFYEGCSLFSIDRYGETAVILWMSGKIQPTEGDKSRLALCCLENLPGVHSVLFKNRYAADEIEKRGILLYGEKAEQSIIEWGAPYNIDLRVNKDAGFYLDSAKARSWLLRNSSGCRVLNTFAYTGSLGDAAAMGGALLVTQTDLNRNYLVEKNAEQEYISGDFFHVMSDLRRSGRLFDRIILDPPFFAKSGRGAKVDQARNTTGLINKIRPLAAHHSKIIVINNALYLSGKDYLAQLESLCGPYLAVSEIIQVPESFYGYEPISKELLPVDPAPFNHPTKIVVLDVNRKDERL